MKRFVPTLIAAVLVLAGWALVRAKVVKSSERSTKTTTAPAAEKEEILWSADQNETGRSGEDPREVFSIGLDRYLHQKIAGASAIPFDSIDPTVISISDELATVKATVQGIKYRGLLRWGTNGWELIQLSRER